MGLRLTEGFDLANKENIEIYNKYKKLLKNVKIVNNHIQCKNIDLLNQSVINLI